MEHRRIEYFAPIKKDVVALRRLLSTLQNKLHGHGPGPRVGVGLPPPPKQRTEKDVADIQSILEHFEVSFPVLSGFSSLFICVFLSFLFCRTRCTPLSSEVVTMWTS